MSIKVKKRLAKTKRIFAKYRKLIKTREIKGQYLGSVRNGNRTKNRILDFYEKHGRWPHRKSEKIIERKLGQRFENFVAKATLTYDPQFRRIVMALGRKSNNKRAHDVKGYKQEILNFIKEHGRVPSTSYEYQPTAGEARLRHKLDYYTQECNDMTLLGAVYAVDKCHKSGVPMKYRQKINQALSDEAKPLIRTV
jgi:hypothetical protein